MKLSKAKTKHLISLCSVFVALSLIPQFTNKVDYRGTSQNAIVIQQNKLALPMIAFVDSQLNLNDGDQTEYSNAQLVSETMQVELKPLDSATHLIIAQLENEKRIQKKLKERKDYEEKMAQKFKPLRSLKIRRVKSKPQVISAQTENKYSIYNSQGELEPLGTRKYKLYKQYKNEVESAQPWQEKAKKLVAKEMKQRKANGKWVSLNSGTQGRPRALYVGGHQNPSKKSAQNSNQQSRHQNNDEINKDQGNEPPSSDDEDGEQNLIAGTNPVYALTVGGHIEMSGGLAFTGSDTHIEVFREKDGVKVEEAQVWIHDAEFEIFLADTEGFLIAKLVDNQGQILGEAEYDLSQIPSLNRNEYKVSDIRLKLKPVSHNYSTKVVSADSFIEAKGSITEAQVTNNFTGQTLAQENGQFKENQVLPSSSFVIQAEKPNYWGSLAIGTSRTKDRIKLFPNQMIETMLDLLLMEGLLTQQEREQAEQQGIIWGRVLNNGRPVKNAEVEIGGDYGLRPVYFNSFIPNHRMSKTGSNGWFVFINVPDGIHSVRAKIKNKNFPAEVTPVRAGHVSNVILDSMGDKKALVQVFDPWGFSEEIKGKLNILGTEKFYNINNSEKIKYPTGHGLMLMEFEGPQGYEKSRVLVDRNVRNIRIPVLREDFLIQMASAQKINLNIRTGIVVGFFNSDDFTVFVGDGTSQDARDIIYIDEHGHTTDSGKAGGGFIIYNVPEGFTNVTIVPKKDQKVLTKTIVSESNVVSVLPY